ncbi:MAG: Hsp20/alpha crystallin family protein [Thermosynechococcaceae cyanobacterium]
MRLSNRAQATLLEVSQTLLHLAAETCQSVEQCLNQASLEHSSSTLWVGGEASGDISAVTVQETEQLIVLTARIPHVAAADLEIQITPETVSIEGERIERVDIEGYCSFQFCSGRFKNVIPLPHRVYPDLLHAELVDGVLTLHLSKSEAIPQPPLKFRLAAPRFTPVGTDFIPVETL